MCSRLVGPASFLLVVDISVSGSVGWFVVVLYICVFRDPTDDAHNAFR